VATMFQLLRLSAFQKYRPHHALQKFRVVQFLAATITDISLVAAVAITERVCIMKSYLIPQRLLAETMASLSGILLCCCIARAQFLLLFTGCGGICLYAAAWLLKYNLITPLQELFFAQHKWDHEVDEATANQDWGRHNAESCISLSGFKWHPITWGMGGACPTTLTYHLEHTMFPGVSYLHYPKIAPIVEATMKEFGVKNKPVVGGQALRALLRSSMNKYAEPPRSRSKAD